MGRGQVIPISPAGHRYSLLPSFKNALEPQFTPAHTLTALPPKVDLTPWCGKVRDQGSLGKCTGAAASGYVEYLYRRFKNLSPDLSDIDLYYKERQKDGDLGQGDTGSYGSTAVQVIQELGVCEISVETRTNDTFEQAPTPEQIVNAAKWKAGAYHAMKLEDIRSCLSSNYPALIGITVYDSFESGDWGSKHVMPAPSGKVLGGHENYIKGCDDTFDCGEFGTGAFDVRNSWGIDWGNNGDYWMPYSTAAAVLNECRMQHLGAPWK
jgi:C1A family cysteine protease